MFAARVATLARRTVLQQQIRKFSTEEGVVKNFNPQKGFGFITRDVPTDPAKPDIFCHFTNIQAPEGSFKTLYQGQRVRFEVQAGEKGDSAVAIQILTPAPARRFTPRDSV